MAVSSFVSAVRSERILANILSKDSSQVFNHLLLAAREGNVMLVQLLLEREVDFSVGWREKLLRQACFASKNGYELCKMFLEKGADCNVPSREVGNTAFLIALVYQTLDVIKLLFNFGADISMVGLRGNTALHYAVRNPSVEVVEFVLDQGFDIEIGNNNGTTPLMAAIKNRAFVACQFLLERGAMANKKASTAVDMSPLALSIRHRPRDNILAVKMVELLLTHGAIVDYEVVSEFRSDTPDIRNALMRNLATMDYRNLAIAEDVREVIDDEDCYKFYYRSCLRELADMEEIKIYNNVSVLRVLIGSAREIFGYLRNDEFLTSLEGKDYDEMFPIYIA